MNPYHVLYAMAVVALAGVVIGYLIASVWSRSRERDAYEEGQIRGFVEGYERRIMADSKVLHETPADEITAE
jgi:hypothetical protein